MIKWYCWIIFITLGVFARDISYQVVELDLQECYDNKYLHEKDNRYPHTLNTFLALIRKMEQVDKNMDLRTLALEILHRFRQDGVIENPNVSRQPGVSPYAPYVEQSAKFAHTLSFIPQSSPLNSESLRILNDVEKCTLHFMLSDSIEIFERLDESMVCKFASAYRRTRSANSNRSAKEKFNTNDVETLTPEQIDIITNRKKTGTEDDVDPNALYPELPPNHPKIARVSLPPYSDCPVENGVIKTNWGPVSIGSVIAGIAAGLQPQEVKLSDLFPRDAQKKPYLSQLLVNNKWITTIAGDLAEVALIQGPLGQKLKIGANGNWNSSAVPRWYFLTHNDSLEFTTAEIRGDIDGLILANHIETLYSKIPRLKLSQILDMYYSPRGFFDPSIRACNRGALFGTISSNASKMMSDQAYSASLVLKEDLQIATLTDNITQGFAKAAADELSANAVSLMKNDLSCGDTENNDHFMDTVQLSADLTIILDTSWPFDLIHSILTNLLDNMNINQYNSQFTIMSGYDGSILTNASETLLDFGYYITSYFNVSKGFDLAKSFDVLQSIQIKKLNDERNGFGNGKSDIVLIIPYETADPNIAKEYCIQQIKRMREQVPDAALFILTSRAKDGWTDYVGDSNVFVTSKSETEDGALSVVQDLISTIRRVPQRLINTQCGAYYSSSESKSNSFVGYIEPKTIISYRIHPNYFHSSDSSHSSTITIESTIPDVLTACTSRQPINAYSPRSGDVHCGEIKGKNSSTFSCEGVEYIHNCLPFYLTIFANSSVENYSCDDPDVCRFPHMIKYSVYYENLVCTNNANINLINTILLIISIIYMFS